MGDRYLVNWLGGTSGAFLTSLLHQFLNKPFNDSDIVFSKFGDAHALSDIWSSNIKFLYEDSDRSGTPVYDYMRPVNESKTMVMIDHLVPNYDDLFKIFPTCKNIVVTVSKKMHLRIIGNMFFKNTCQGYPENNIFWNTQRNKHNCISQYEDPNFVPADAAKIYIEEFSDTYVNEYDFFGDNYVFPAEYKDNITTIKFYDIIHNSEAVLNQLSELTNKPILDGHYNFYKKYLDKQAQLVAENMPWLLDESKI